MLPLQEVSRLTWEIQVGESPLADDEVVAKDWTYYDDIYIKCSFEIDLKEARESLRLAPAARLGAALIARSSGTPLVIPSEIHEVRTGHQQIYFTVPGYQISGSLSVEFQLSLLDQNFEPRSPFAPKKLGNTVYRVERKVVLEGTAPRLPMLPVSFTEHGFSGAGNSLWWLRLTNHDLMTSASAAIWLWLNSDNPYVITMLESSESGEAETWLRFLEIDFMRQLLREALNHDELSFEMDYPEDSLGHVLASVVRLLGESLDQVKQRYREDAGRVEAELQAKIGGK